MQCTKYCTVQRYIKPTAGKWLTSQDLSIRGSFFEMGLQQERKHLHKTENYWMKIKHAMLCDSQSPEWNNGPSWRFFLIISRHSYVKFCGPLKSKYILLSVVLFLYRYVSGSWSSQYTISNIRYTSFIFDYVVGGDGRLIHTIRSKYNHASWSSHSSQHFYYNNTNTKTFMAINQTHSPFWTDLSHQPPPIIVHQIQIEQYTQAPLAEETYTKAAISADTFFPTLDGRGTHTSSLSWRMDTFQLHHPKGRIPSMNNTVTLSADEVLRKSQLKTFTVAVNNTKDVFRVTRKT